MPEKHRTRASALVLHQNKILLFRGEDPVTKHQMLLMPGGGLETGESPAQAVLRETLEETGYRIRLLDDPPPFWMEYPFVWNGTLFHCRTWFTRGELDPADQKPIAVADCAYHLGVEWVDADRPGIFEYSEAVAEAARRLFK